MLNRVWGIRAGFWRVWTLGFFFMAQTPITQAQWRAVAGWQKVGRDLKPDPPKF
jgi:hypothetical protein